MTDRQVPRSTASDNVRTSRIVIFDQQVANFSLLQNVLNRVGYKSISGFTNYEALGNVLLEGTADLIVFSMDGEEDACLSAVKQTRNNIPRNEWVPVLAISANPDPALRQRAFASGVSEFLAKPFDWGEFVLRLRNVLLVHRFKERLKEQNRLLEYLVEARTKSLTQRTAELENTLAELKGTQKQVVQQERFRAFGELAGGIAHDFNNVLMCVIGYSELMLHDKNIVNSSPNAAKFLRTMNTAGNDASKIVARLRNFYRPREEADVFTRTDLNKLVGEVIPLTQPKWKNKALNGGFVIEVATDLTDVPEISCNAPEIRESLVNLVFNAVDAMPEGGTITLRTRLGEGYVDIGVSDTGCGMSEEVRQKCMEPFFSTKGEKGTGLGLAMVFGIAKRHDGMVDIESQPGVGTTIWIRLSSALAEHIAAEAANVVPSGLRILAVDDEELPRDILARYLTADGHDVQVAVDAFEASRMFDLAPFDLVITDHAMPGINGCQFALNLRKRANPAILLITGSCDAVMADGLPAGLNHAVGKPITREGLRVAMARALANHRARKDALLEEAPASENLPAISAT